MMLISRFSLVAFACATVLYIFISKILTQLRRRKLPGYSQCKPVKQYPLQDDRLGIKWVKGQWAAYKSQRYLEHALQKFQACGNTFTGPKVGKTYVQTIDEENIKTILTTNFKDYGLGPRMGQMGPFLGKGIFTTDGGAWQHSRALVRPNFTRMQLRDLDILERHVKQLLDRIPTDGSTVDMQELFFCLTVDSATELLFGESVESLRNTDEHSEHHQFVEAYDFCQARVLIRPKFALLRALWRDKEFEKKCKTVHNYVDKYVSRVLASSNSSSTSLNEKLGALDDAEKAQSQRYVFLEELAKETRDPVRLRDEVLNVLLAGRDTTASLLSNTFHVLARNPRIWDKLCAEVDSELAGAKPTYEQLRNMTYLRYLLNESLRLYPVVPVNMRYAVRDTILPHGGGDDEKSPILIPAGKSVSYHVFSMHRRTDIYGADAEEFRPERWETIRPGWGYLPFNGGPRICPGQQFALTEASYTVVRIVQSFKNIESRDAEPWKELLGMTTASFNGTKVALTLREET